MDIKERKIVDMLTNDSVSILTQQFVELDGKLEQIGQNHRISYVNSGSGREELQKNESTDVINAVLALWGNEPSIEESEVTNEQEG